jgi:hypothetical protein
MSSLILVVGYLGFSYKQVPCPTSPDPFFLRSAASIFVVFSFSPSAHQGGQAGDRDLN